MPNKKSLPDILFDNWKSFALIRSFFSIYIIPTLFTLILIILSLILIYNKFNICNIKKIFILFSFSNLIRCLFFMSTQLSPPCIGYSNCTCSINTYDKIIEKKKPFVISMVYFITFGIGTINIPACGDFMMSGSISLQWIIGLFIIETFLYDSNFSILKFNILIRISLLIFTIFQIFIRNQYTIGAALSITFIELSWLFYGGLQALNDKGYSPFLTTKFGHLFSWIEDNNLIYNEDLNKL